MGYKAKLIMTLIPADTNYKILLNVGISSTKIPNAKQSNDFMKNLNTPKTYYCYDYAKFVFTILTCNFYLRGCFCWDVMCSHKMSVISFNIKV